MALCETINRWQRDAHDKGLVMRKALPYYDVTTSSEQRGGGWKRNLYIIFQFLNHKSDVIMSALVSHITSVSIVCSTVCSSAERKKKTSKHQSSASLACVRGIHRWPVNSPHKGPVTRKMFPFDDVIMCQLSGRWGTTQSMLLALAYRIFTTKPSHYNDVIMGVMASQITSLTSVYSTVYSGADQRKHQSSASLAFVLGIHRGPVNSPHKWPVTRKMLPFDDVIMTWANADVLPIGPIWTNFPDM